MNTKLLTLQPHEGKEITNGRKMRRLCGGRFPVLQVNVWKLAGNGHPSGILQITFDRPGLGPLETVREEWRSLGVLAWALREWRNLKGAPLVYEGKPAGTVNYNNSVLAELAK